MPEYQAPGVYIEETSFRAKSIEGVPTGTAGFAGLTRYGPVWSPDGPDVPAPRLITSYPEFERAYGGATPLQLGSGRRSAYLAHAVRAYFDNGGRRLHVSRVYAPGAGKTVRDGTASRAVATSTGTARWWARWPGADGNLRIEVRAIRGGNLAFAYPSDAHDPLARHTWGIQAQGIGAGAVVEVTPPGSAAPADNAPLSASQLRVVEADHDGRQRFIDSSGAAAALAAGVQLRLVELRVTVSGTDGRVDRYGPLASHPDQRRFIGTVLNANRPDDAEARVCLEWAPGSHRFAAAALAIGLQAADKPLAGGIDGELPDADDFAGTAADPADGARPATGLEALGAVDDIAIVAVPDGGAMSTAEGVQAVAGRLIAHAEKYRYRIAVVDPAQGSSLSAVRSFRSRFDSRHAALYYPWIEIADPDAPAVAGQPAGKLLLPPSGFIAGIYARSDVERGVHKTPANELVRGLTRFEFNINKAQQDVLNVEGINCLRYFEGRGHRVWGARTISSDPEWKYVSQRRLFSFIEHSIDKATQWVAFEPNGERLWANVRSSIEDFLLSLWRDGALLGSKPEEAFFVRCDRSTMTRNDLDNGRLVCLIGIATSRPAEFVVFRIGRQTADVAA